MGLLGDILKTPETQIFTTTTQSAGVTVPVTSLVEVDTEPVAEAGAALAGAVEGFGNTVYFIGAGLLVLGAAFLLFKRG